MFIGRIFNQFIFKSEWVYEWMIIFRGLISPCCIISNTWPHWKVLLTTFHIWLWGSDILDKDTHCQYVFHGPYFLTNHCWRKRKSYYQNSQFKIATQGLSNVCKTLKFLSSHILFVNMLWSFQFAVGNFFTKLL